MEQFLQKIEQRINENQFDTALSQCRQSMGSFVRSYTAFALLKGYDPEQLILQFNERFLDKLHDEQELKKEVNFYIKTLDSLPHVKSRLGLK